MIGRLDGETGGIRGGRMPAAVFCILALGAILSPAGPAGAQDPAGQSGRISDSSHRATDGTLVVIHWPSASLHEWEECDGLPTRRFVDTCRDQGWILDVSDLRPDEIEALDAWSEHGRLGVSWLGDEAGPPASLLLGSGAVDGETGEGRAPMLLEHAGVDSRSVEGLEAETRVWLSRPQHLRWEEVVELLDLTGFENLAFRLLEDPGHPFQRLRSAFLEDKDESNLGLYLLGSRHPRALVWSLDLARVYETELTPFLRTVLELTPKLEGIDPGDWESVPADEKEQARRRFFCWRVLGSAGRIYGRCDRIFQSLRAEGPKGAWIILDARSAQGASSAPDARSAQDWSSALDARSAQGASSAPDARSAQDWSSAPEMRFAQRTETESDSGRAAGPTTGAAAGFIAVARISGSLGPAEQRGDLLVRLLNRPGGERS